MPFDQTNTATTLSLRFRPGQDLRTFPTDSRSVFTYGNYRMERSIFGDPLSTDTRHSSFDGYESLSSLNITGVTVPKTIFVTSSELKLKQKEASAFVYFGTFKTEIAIAISNIIDNWPYGILALSISSADTTVYDYSALTASTVIKSQFKVPFSAITNQGGIVLNSGSTRQGRSLVIDTPDFVVQLSGTSLSSTPQYTIDSYSFSAGEYLVFTINGLLLGTQLSGTSTLPLYVRPNDKIIEEFKRSIGPLEKHLLYKEKFLFPNPYYDDGSFYERTFTWPKTIDGFNPNVYGSDFNIYKDSLLQFAQDMDDQKTDVLIRSVIPENYLELDSEQTIYKNTVQAFAHQFDELKRYVDGIAFAHTVTYDGEDNLPDKFLFKLSRLLGLKLPNTFSEIDLFNYLTNDEDGDGNSLEHYNLELWKRVLVNIIWLFKKKGTRDALMFIFRLIGAPDCLIRLNEFVYDIQSTFDLGITEFSASTILQNDITDKINDNGYIDYKNSKYIFQEGGKGRGDGRKYIDQWEPEFYPILRADNIKTQTGNSVFFGTENIVNTKELDCALDPAKGIECNVHTFYQLSGICWVWGSEDPFMFENLTVPFEYVIEDCSSVAADEISGMTLNQYMEFIYKSNVEPTRRKTAGGGHTMFHYPELRKIYLNYYYLTNPTSDQLTFKKIEKFLNIIELNFFNYSEQLIPATSILRAYGTVYRNTEFNRQRFIYKEGINAGSEFRADDPTVRNPSGITIIVSNVFDDILNPSITPVIVDGEIITTLEDNLDAVTINMEVVSEMTDTIDGFRIEMLMPITEEIDQNIEITRFE